MTTVEVIDDFGGNVIGTNPQDGDLIRTTLDNGAVIEHRFYHQVIGAPEIEDAQ